MSIRLSPPLLRFIVAAGFLFVVLLVSGSHWSTTVWAAGNTYKVNSTADSVDADVGNPACADASGRCTLRAAIQQANFGVGADTIILPAGTFKLTRAGDEDAAVLGDLDIADDLTIKGAGSGNTIVDGNGKVTMDRVFQILASAHETNLSGLTIRNGKKDAGPFDEGGGLLWEGGGGHLHLDGVILEKNKASYYGGLAIRYSAGGGAVELDGIVLRRNSAKAAAGGLGADLTSSFGGFELRDSRIYSNTAYEGGGLYLQGTTLPFNLYSARIETTQVYSNTASLSGGFENRAGNANVSIQLLNSNFHNNSSGIYGGAIGNYGTLIISNDSLNENSAVSNGGAIYNYQGGQTTLTNDTLSGNSAHENGGGIYAYKSTTSLTNVTLSGNSADKIGGGIYADQSTTTLTNVTMSGNSGGTFVGGIYNSAGPLALANTLLAKGSNGFNCNLQFGGSFNLSDDGSCGFGVGDNVADLMLGPLADNGGPTKTHLPEPGSPALDHGNGIKFLFTDQRGISRPQGTAWDVGAVEVCPGKPGNPGLVSPRNTRGAAGPKVKLDWNDVTCIQSYTVIIRLGSATGTKVQKKKHLSNSTFTTRPLTKGQRYYWQVTAIGDQGTAKSEWWSFTVK